LQLSSLTRSITGGTRTYCRLRWRRRRSQWFLYSATSRDETWPAGGSTCVDLDEDCKKATSYTFCLARKSSQNKETEWL